MSWPLICWIICAAVMCLVAIVLGLAYRKSWLGILIDTRGRYSLTHLQLVAWSIVIISLIAAVAFLRLGAPGKTGALDFDIPNQVLLLLGISVTSAVTSTVIKAQKDQNSATAKSVATSDSKKPPKFAQVFLLEEGKLADKVIDISKFQAFFVTLILILAYVGAAVAMLSGTQPENITALPDLSTTFVTLLGISHAGYLAGKIPNRPGVPEGANQAQTINESPPPPAK